MEKMNRKVSLGIIVLSLFAASVYAAPYWTVYKMRTAIIDNDAESFSERVDFSVLRENLKVQFMLKLTEKMASSDMKDNPFAALGNALAAGLVNQMVDALITPSGVMMMINNAKPKPVLATEKKNTPEDSSTGPSPKSEPKAPAEYSLTYQNWSTVKAQSKTSDASTGAFIFKRNGLWSWKLSGVELPPI